MLILFLPLQVCGSKLRKVSGMDSASTFVFNGFFTDCGAVHPHNQIKVEADLIQFQPKS